jgi:hypothetical protein
LLDRYEEKKDIIVPIVVVILLLIMIFISFDFKSGRDEPKRKQVHIQRILG